MTLLLVVDRDHLRAYPQAAARVRTSCGLGVVVYTLILANKREKATPPPYPLVPPTPPTQPSSPVGWESRLHRKTSLSCQSEGSAAI